MTGPTHGPVAPARGNAASFVARFPDRSPPLSEAGAAVVIVARDGLHELETLLIERTRRDDDPASGQIGLPGGHVDPTDPDLRGAALRELDEEVGLGASDLTGPLRYVATAPARRFGLTVGVFAGELGPSGGPPKRHSPTEVQDVFWLPKSALDRTERVLWEGRDGPLEVDANLHQGRVLWGFTRRVLRHAVLGEPLPS